MSKRFVDFYIAAAEQWLTWLETATSKTGGSGTVGRARMDFDTSGKFAAYEGIVSILQGEVKQSWSLSMNTQLN